MEQEKNIKQDSNYKKKPKKNFNSKKQDNNKKKSTSNRNKNKSKNARPNKKKIDNQNNKQYKNSKNSSGPQKNNRHKVDRNDNNNKNYENKDTIIDVSNKTNQQPTNTTTSNETRRVDDHPRAVVLCFDQKAIEDIKPRKYTSGYEIYRIPISLARSLAQDNFLESMTQLTGIEFLDKKFIILRRDELTNVKSFCLDKRKNRKLDKDLRNFYSHIAYFVSYTEKFDTAIAFHL